MLNVVFEPVIINAAKRNIKKMNIVPLFYDAYKAAAETLSFENMYKGLKRAHDYSGIGIVSNNLTKLWNTENPDLFAAACITRYNNAVIDAAKTGELDSYENYPEVYTRILESIGGKRGKLPWFFQFSKNGRKNGGTKPSDVEKSNNSTMNRICAAFDDIRKLDLRYAGIGPFNVQMLLSENDIGYDQNIVQIFCSAVDESVSTRIEMNEAVDLADKSRLAKKELLIEFVTDKITEVMPLSEAYKSIVKYLFDAEGLSRKMYKQEFWAVFGSIALRNLALNLKDYSECPKCKMKLPPWGKSHICVKARTGFIECVDCGNIVERLNSRQCRCPDCQKVYRRIQVRTNVKRLRERRGA